MLGVVIEGRGGIDMDRRKVALGLALAVAATTPIMVAAAAPEPIQLEDARVIVEVNDTDGDAGFQVFLDGEPWKRVAIHGPDGRELIDFRTSGVVDDYGLTELFSESSEPPFTQFPLSEFKALFPEGTYSFEATAIDGTPMTGRARLSHDIPDGPVILAPDDGDTLPRDEVVVRWKAGSQPDGVEIVGYQVIVTREDPLRILSVDLPASVTRLQVPVQFLQPGTEYAIEVLAIERSGNQTLTEIFFEIE
jgi:Fibronectin type III domain